MFGFLIVIVVNDVHSSNAFPAIFVTLLGIVISFNFESPLKAPYSILSILSGK